MFKTFINKPVNITAVSFRRGRALPRRMEYEGDIYTFQDEGLQYRITKGERTTHILDMTDGIANFRLKSDDEASWTLVAIGH